MIFLNRFSQLLICKAFYPKICYSQRYNIQPFPILLFAKISLYRVVKFFLLFYNCI